MTSMTFLILMIILLAQLITFNVFYFFWSKKKFELERRDLLYRNSEKILIILQDIKAQAYDKTFKEYVLVRAVDRIKLNHRELREASTQYIKYIVDYCGNNLIKDISEIYGNEENFYNFLMDGFVTKIILDEHQIIDDKLNSEEVES